MHWYTHGTNQVGSLRLLGIRILRNQQGGRFFFRYDAGQVRTPAMWSQVIWCSVQVAVNPFKLVVLTFYDVAILMEDS